MSFFSFFQTRKPRQFDYTPRYYDPQKEAREERIRQIEAEIAAEKGEHPEEHYTTLRRGFLRDAREIRRKHDLNSGFRLLAILIILLFLIYILVYR